MADTAELKQMVSGFRVSELQALLMYAGKSKSGRKQELMDRALDMLRHGVSTPIQIKIRELFRRISGNRPAVAATGTGTVRYSNQTQPESINQYGGQKSPVKPTDSTSRGEHLLGTAIDYSGKNITSVAQSQVPVHPDVRLKSLPFYDVLAELIKPTSLVPRSTSRFQDTYFVFHLTPQQAQDIAMSRDIRPNAKVEFTVQVQLRFSLLETTCPQDDNFPPSICVRVNGKMAPLPNPIPTNKPGVEPKRPGRPVNITSICRISPTIPNHISVSWATELGRGYCLAVHLVRHNTSDILLSRLRHTGIRHADHSRALIKEKLAHDHDSEIAATSLRVSLVCPLGKMRINLPCRPTTCNHLQCFDAATYLMMNEKKPTWVCPVCDKPALFSTLVLEGLFMEILKAVPTEQNEIEFLHDGSWSYVHDRKEVNLISSPQVSNVATVIDDSNSPKAASSQKKNDVIIDLTCDDSDDDDPSLRCKEEGPLHRPTESRVEAISASVFSSNGDSLESRGYKRKVGYETVTIDDKKDVVTDVFMALKKRHLPPLISPTSSVRSTVGVSSYGNHRHNGMGMLSSATATSGGRSLTSLSSSSRVISTPPLPQMPGLTEVLPNQSAPPAHRMTRQPPFLVPAPGINRTDPKADLPTYFPPAPQREILDQNLYNFDLTSAASSPPLSQYQDLTGNNSPLTLNTLPPGSLMEQPTPVDFYSSLNSLFGNSTSRDSSPLDLEIIPLDD